MCPQGSRQTASLRSWISDVCYADMVGKYCWRAEYSGDSFYTGSTHTDATNECFTTVKQPSSTDTFFNPAEGGIRALYVTGVQTCALPISNGPAPTGTVTFFLCGPDSSLA